MYLIPIIFVRQNSVHFVLITLVKQSLMLVNVLLLLLLLVKYYYFFKFYNWRVKNLDFKIVLNQ